jgi:hypothetical protein
MADGSMQSTFEVIEHCEQEPTTAKITFCNGEETIDGLGGHTVLDFWRWAYSDITSNRNRSILAEYLVGLALRLWISPEWNETP